MVIESPTQGRWFESIPPHKLIPFFGLIILYYTNKKIMAKSEDNLRVIQNFILHVTRCNEGDFEAGQPINLTADQLYQMAYDYIEEDHVDGKPADSEN